MLFRYDAIVFDFDGTLVKSNEIKTWAFGKLYEKYGENIVRLVTDYHEKNTGISRFEKFRYWHKNLLHQSYTDEVGKKLSQKFSQLVLDSVVEAPYVEGALRFLNKYYLDLPLFIASGIPEKELREIITRRTMSRFFWNVFGSPSTKTELLNSIIEKHSLQPERVLMVGDAIADFEGAESAGIEFIGIQSEKDPNLFPPTQVLLKNLETLEKYVTNF